MVDSMVIDEVELTKPEMNSAKKSLKRKRISPVESLSTEDKTAQINVLREELDGLFKYYKEVSAQKPVFDLSECGSSNSRIACLLEESDLPLFKLVDAIYEKVKESEGSNVTLATVKSSVLFIGQRSFYGVPNVDADVLEDDSESCLWCWETRDIKLMPKAIQGALKIRRICRKKIHERITAVSAIITALQNLECSENNKHELVKALERLGKVLKETDIRLLVESMIQKNGADMAEKQAKREEKLLIKQLERNKREIEKEKKRMDRESEKEKWQSEKELKRLQEEAEKEERRREKEESEIRKQQKKQQEESEKEQRRREKEEAEMKRQLALQKQASIMERFLKSRKDEKTCPNNQSLTSEPLSHSSTSISGPMTEPVTQTMDSALSLKDGVNTQELRRSHLTSWRSLGQTMRLNRKQHWGIRKKPKIEIVKKLKLTTNKGLVHDDEVNIDRLADGLDGKNVDGRSCDTNIHSSSLCGLKSNRSKQLLQFDKSHRPAFYGIWTKQSNVVGSRHPLVKDPELDYDIDSDEEWEEEEPGESLSDCDKDDEDESLEEVYPKADEEDESEDDFFVPDGYLSENEGVEVDKKSDHTTEEARSSPGLKPELETGMYSVLFRQQKQLNTLTEQALRKNQPLIISNLMHEKSYMLLAEDLTGVSKVEQICLKALSIIAFPGSQSIEISLDSDAPKDQQEGCKSNSKGNATPATTASALLESDLPQVVSAIKSCPQGINKVVESLQQTFPTVSKTQLRNKVREISDFVDNRWQVKKEVLEKLGLSTSPEKIGSSSGGKRTKSIATFFSKRCLPPASDSSSPNDKKSIIKQFETSPVSASKSAVVQQQLQEDHPSSHT